MAVSYKKKKLVSSIFCPILSQNAIFQLFHWVTHYGFPNGSEAKASRQAIFVHVDVSFRTSVVQTFTAGGTNVHSLSHLRCVLTHRPPVHVNSGCIHTRTSLIKLILCILRGA